MVCYDGNVLLLLDVLSFLSGNLSSLSYPPTTSSSSPSALRSHDFLPHGIGGIRRMIAASLVNLGLNLATLIFSVVLLRKHALTVAPSIFGTMASSLALALVLVYIYSARKAALTSNRWQSWIQITMRAICFISLISIIFSLIIFTLDGIGKYKAYVGLAKRNKVTLIIMSSVEIGSNATLAFVAAQLMWSPAHRAARSFMMISSVLLFVVGTLLVSTNSQPWLPDINAQANSSKTFALHQHVGTLATAVAVLGFAICTAIHESDRINRLFTQFIQFYVIFSAFVVLVFVAVLIMSLNKFVGSSRNDTAIEDSLMVDLIIDGSGLLLLIVNFICSNYLQQPPSICENKLRSSRRKRKQCTNRGSISIHGEKLTMD